MNLNVQDLKDLVFELYLAQREIARLSQEISDLQRQLSTSPDPEADRV